ncbi:MAG TPA: aldehyde dehydrogenase family protein [Thermomicrobiales bacterium]|nr:aldehyde dehydrogenase family protein [Thermomicrobiales bacterium]
MAATDLKITYTSTPEQIEAMHSFFDDAIEEVRADLGKTYPLIIDGDEVTGRDTFEVHAPADRRMLVGVFQKGTPDDVERAVAAAKAAYPAWSGRPWQERVELVRRAADLIRERKYRLSAILIYETGKSRTEAIGEIEEGADLLSEYAEQVEKSNGFVTPMGTVDPREHNVSILRPFGVWAVLGPFNFPHALCAGMSSGALVAGNTIVFKPASATPLSGYEIARAYVDAGVPAGVVNFVTGGGEAVGERLVTHPDVDGAVFTGSKEVGFDLYKRFATDFPKPIITEMGGKNPTIVTTNADLDKAVEGVARSAFGFSGQKCSACSRVYVERDVYEPFLEKLVERAGQLVIGDGLQRESFVGPVIDDKAVQRFEEAVEIAERDGGTVRFGGEVLTDGQYANGTYVQPTIVDGLPLDHELFKRELFLPFVAVAPVDSLDQALEEANDTEYGLTAGVFTEDEGEIQEFFDRIIAGVVYANRSGGATTGAWPGCQSFCGWKGSGSSGKGGLGPYYVQQFLREQSQTRVVESDGNGRATTSSDAPPTPRGE